MKKTSSILFTITVLALIILPLPKSIRSQGVKNQTSSNTVSKFALLVGVNDYLNQDVKENEKLVSDLNGTHNDVALMKELLEEYGFTETKAKGSVADFPCGRQTETSQLKTLCSRQATKKAIDDAFRKHLIENAKKYKEQNNVTPDKGANIVFYYSGHGSFLDDDNGDEPDGFDETIMPTDSKWDGTNQIRDDDLNKLISELRAFTTNITLILDSCHSGTATRGNGAKRFISKTSGAAKGGARGNNKNLEDSMDLGDGYVTISGSLPNELSYEDYFPNPKTKEVRSNGALTYNFVTFARQNPGATYRDVMNLVRNAVVNLGRSQTPQAEGDVDRTVFGSSASKGKVPIYPQCEQKGGEQICSEIEKITENGKETEIHKVKMNVGKIIGARKGGVIAVYSPQAKELAGDADKIGTGTITFAGQFSSEADVILTDKTVKKFPENAKIVIVSPNFTDERRTVALDFTPSLTARGSALTDAGLKVLTQLLNEKLKDNAYVEPVKTSDLLKTFNQVNTVKPENNPQWDVAVVRATYKDFKFGNEQKNSKGEVPKDEDEVFFISDRNGMPMYNFFVRVDENGAAEKIKSALEMHVRLENLRMLGNEASKLNEQIKIEFIRLKELNVEDDTCKAVPYDEKTKLQDQTGTPKIKAAKTSEKGIEGDSFYFRITNKSDKDLFIYIYSLDAKGEIKLIYPPKNVSEKLVSGNTIVTNKQNPCAVYYFSADDPTGKETLKVLVTENEIPAELLAQPAIYRRSGSRGGDSPLASFLERVAYNQKAGSRNAKTFSASVGNWTAINFDYEIVP